MVGLILDGLRIPRPHFAHEVAVDGYSWKTGSSPEEGLTQIEIALTHQGDMSILCEGTEYRNEGEPFLLCTSSCADIRAEAVFRETVRECTVSILWDSAHVRFGELTEELLTDPDVLLLPLFLCPCPELRRVENLILTYISGSVSNQASDRAVCVSAWFELVSVLDKFARRPIEPSRPRTAGYFTKKLDYWIESRYRAKLALSDLAAEMHVTPNYLSSVYRSMRGVRFSEALLTFRMRKARELLRDRSMSLSDVAEAVGFGSETYFRRQFRRFYGVTPSEFRRIDGELTLFCQKPIRPKENASEEEGPDC